MRSCDEIAELISASLDGELSADEQTALDEHIAHCPACSALLDDLRALHTAAADWEEVPAPAGFTESVMSAIAAETVLEKPDNVIPFVPKKAKHNYWKKWGISAAAIAIVVLGAVSAPSLMGNFAHKNAVAEDADMAYIRNDDTAEMAVVADMAEADSSYAIEHSKTSESKAETQLAEPAPGEALDQKGENSAPYDPNDNVPAPSTAPQADNPVSSKPPKERVYVGILLLEGTLDSLSGQEGSVSNDGTVTYLVSADVFAEVLKVLEAEKPVGYAYTAGTPDAPLGKIIVQSN